MISSKRNTMTTTVWLVATTTVLAAGLLIAACGMVPPPEYHVVADTPETEMDHLLDGESSPDAGPVAADGDGGVLGEPPVALLQLGIGMSTIPAIPLSALLGKTRDSIEILLSPVRPETREERKTMREQEKLGWVQYTQHLKIRYDADDYAMEMIQQVPSALNCRNAARWMGFADAMAPEEADGICKWSKGSTDHSLGEGIHGKLENADHIFTSILDESPAPVDEEEKPLPEAD